MPLAAGMTFQGQVVSNHQSLQRVMMKGTWFQAIRSAGNPEEDTPGPCFIKRIFGRP
jgi:hypothetical protein